MEKDRLVRWLYALGIGCLMFSATLFLFLTYRYTDEAFLAEIVTLTIGFILSVGGLVLSREWSPPGSVASKED